MAGKRNVESWKSVDFAAKVQAGCADVGTMRINDLMEKETGPALLRPPIPRNCRLPFGFPKFRRMCIRCRAAISSLSTSPRTNQACLTRSSIVPQVFSSFLNFRFFRAGNVASISLCTEQDLRSSNIEAHIIDIYSGISGEPKEYRH